MARVTVEDCLKNVENRFELVMSAAKRAREIAVKGSEPLVTAQNDKPTVIALREIAEGVVAEATDNTAEVPTEVTGAIDAAATTVHNETGDSAV